jgi:hypothetical protein
VSEIVAPLPAPAAPPAAAPPAEATLAAPAAQEQPADSPKYDEKSITLVCPTCHAFHNIKIPQTAIKQITGLELSNVLVSIPCGATVELFFDAKRTMLDARPAEIINVKYVVPEATIPERPASSPAPAPDTSAGVTTTKESPAPAPVELSAEEMAGQIQQRIQKIETHLLDLEISFLNEKLPEKQYKALTGKLLSIKEQLVKQLGEIPK